MSELAITKSRTRLRLRVTAAAEKLIRSGHPWLFDKSILESNREGRIGELAIIYDRKDRFLALGLYDPNSPIRVRVLHTGEPVVVDRHWWASRLELALQRRQGLFDAQTTGYRWVHGESDGWPGFVLDRYGSSLVLKLYTAAWLPHLEQLVPLIIQRLEPEHLVLRLSRNITPLALDQFHKKDGELLHGKGLLRPVVFLETGLRFEADILRGQKTGFFLDQRENRRHVESLADGRDVLNAFSFSGGFSLYAARGGARSVTDLDISSHALRSAENNFALNRAHDGIRRCRHEMMQADAFEWLIQNKRRKFDLIILDPPSLAKRKTERAAAMRAYLALVASAIKRIEPGGILVACSCSAHVGRDEFFQLVFRAAAESGRRFVELRRTGHPPDQRASFAEAEYLKAIYLQEAGTAR